MYIIIRTTNAHSDDVENSALIDHVPTRKDIEANWNIHKTRDLCVTYTVIELTRGDTGIQRGQLHISEDGDEDHSWGCFK